MRDFVNNQFRHFELLQERQKIINELKELKVASTVSIVSPRENNPVSSEFIPANEDIFPLFGEEDTPSSIWKIATPILSLYTEFDNTFASLSIEDSYQSIKAYFKDNFNIKAKIKVIEKAHFKIFTP